MERNVGKERMDGVFHGGVSMLLGIREDVTDFTETTRVSMGDILAAVGFGIYRGRYLPADVYVCLDKNMVLSETGLADLVGSRNGILEYCKKRISEMVDDTSGMFCQAHLDFIERFGVTPPDKEGMTDPEVLERFAKLFPVTSGDPVWPKLAPLIEHVEKAVRKYDRPNGPKKSRPEILRGRLYASERDVSSPESDVAGIHHGDLGRLWNLERKMDQGEADIRDLLLALDIRVETGEDVPADRFDHHVSNMVLSERRLHILMQYGVGIVQYCKGLVNMAGLLDPDRLAGLGLDKLTEEERKSPYVRGFLAQRLPVDKKGWIWGRLGPMIKGFKDALAAYVLPEGPATAPLDIRSGVLCVSDPCYDRDTWCAAWGLPAKPGRFTAYAWKRDDPFGFPGGMPDIRCAMLEIVHDGTDSDDLEWERTGHDIGVDSGQAGFFDQDMYRGRSSDDGESWYEECSSSVLPGDHNRLLRKVDGGVVSDSGHGDGGYDLWVKKKDGLIVRAAVVYLPVETRDDDEEDGYHYDGHPDEVRGSCFGGR